MWVKKGARYVRSEVKSDVKRNVDESSRGCQTLKSMRGRSVSRGAGARLHQGDLENRRIEKKKKNCTVYKKINSHVGAILRQPNVDAFRLPAGFFILLCDAREIGGVYRIYIYRFEILNTERNKRSDENGGKGRGVFEAATAPINVVDG